MSDAAAPHALRVHQFHGLRPGPRLLVLGAVHGNEIAGTLGIQRVLAELDQGRCHITRGTVSFVPITNPLAHQLGRLQALPGGGGGTGEGAGGGAGTGSSGGDSKSSGEPF